MAPPTLKLASAAFMIYALTISYHPPPSCLAAHRPVPVTGFETRMIHRSSPESPLYDPNASPGDLSRLAARAARARRARKTTRGEYGAPGTDAYIPPLTPFGIYAGEYLIQYSIGSDPPTQTYGIPDTGSRLILLQCRPCTECYPQVSKLFEPSTSTSYRQVRCSDKQCIRLYPTTTCLPRDPNYCHYSVTYEDTALSEGDLATETITLSDEGPGKVVRLSNMVFGCGHYNINHRPTNTSLPGPPGVVGLSRDPVSLIGQLSFNLFSYCASANRLPDAGHGLLKIGLGAIITCKNTQTPLYSAGDSGHYFVKVTGLMLDGTKLNIHPSVFELDEDGTRGTMIDTGSTFTELVPEAFDALKNAIKDRMEEFYDYPVHVSDPVFELCYEDVSNAPRVTIMFENVNFDISTINTWDLIEPRKYCLAILRGEQQSVVGMFQQRNVNVGFDLKNNFVSLQNMNCPLVK